MQDQRLLEHGLHLLGVGDEVRRQIAAVEPHALRRPRPSSRCPWLPRPTSCPPRRPARARRRRSRRCVVSLWAEIVATCTRCLWSATGRDSSFRRATTARKRAVEPALQIDRRWRRPRCSSRPRRRSPRRAASTSSCRRPPASPVRSAAWRMTCAPRFSSWSSSSNSLAIVTPSLQTSGRPHFFSMSTHFDFGPSVTRTASASAVAPCRIFLAGRGLDEQTFMSHEEPPSEGLVPAFRQDPPVSREGLCNCLAQRAGG